LCFPCLPLSRGSPDSTNGIRVKASKWPDFFLVMTTPPVQDAATTFRLGEGPHGE
jgi:hypothetical protein